MSVDDAELDACLATLARLDDADLDDTTRRVLERAVVAASRGVKKRARSLRSERTRAADRALLASATRFHSEIPPTAPTGSPRVVESQPPVESPKPFGLSAPIGSPTPVDEGVAAADETAAPGGTSAGGTSAGETSAGTAAADKAAAGGAGARAGGGRLIRERRCYVCKAGYREVDVDYHLMCPPCAAENRAHRHARCDLSGRTGVVTGGRVKIGFHTALKLLRDGADVIVTTRFPRDAARRYAAVADFDDWADRLYVHGLDLLDLPGMLDFVALVGRRLAGLDILVNNAAQTLHRPAAYHRDVRAAESTALHGPAARVAIGAAPTPAPDGTEPAAGNTAGFPDGAGNAARSSPDGAGDTASSRDGAHPAAGNTVGSRDGAGNTARSPDGTGNAAAIRDGAGAVAGPHRSAEVPALLDAFFPPGLVDETGQQLDLRGNNSWMLRDADVSPQEWLRVHVVNAFAPFLLTSRLRPLMEASTHPQRHVVQVSAMEGSYSRSGKTTRHPHTNMAKAALNMLVRTAADDYAASGVYMNSVDTGWVTDERPHPTKTAQRDLGFRPPLDVIDGAARVYDPVVRGVRGAPVSGQFLKDYRSVPW